MDSTDRLKGLRKALDRSREVNAELENMKTYREALEQKVKALKGALEKEEQDITDLQTLSISNIILSLRGKLNESVDGQKVQVLAVRLKLAETEKELDELTSRINELSEEQLSLAGCESDYKQRLEQKKLRLINIGNAVSQRLSALSEETSRAESRHMKTSEALAACESVLASLGGVIEKLNNAENPDEWDTRGLIGTIIMDYMDEKHNINMAVEQAKESQRLFNIFKANAADIEILRDAYTNTGFLVTDILFDSFIADRHVERSISKLKSCIEAVRSEMFCDVLKLKKLSEKAQQSLSRLTAQLDELVLGAAE